MANIDNVCDYIILMCDEADERLNFLKLQKLLYYVQAWNLAFTGSPLFRGKFQAWIHGPVNRRIYDRFKDTKTLYSRVSLDDMQEEFDPEVDLTADDRQHIQNVLEVYAQFSDSDLEAQTHDELPWIKAREGFRPTQRCERELDEGLMASYYGNRIESD